MQEADWMPWRQRMSTRSAPRRVCLYAPHVRDLPGARKNFLPARWAHPKNTIGERRARSLRPCLAGRAARLDSHMQHKECTMPQRSKSSSGRSSGQSSRSRQADSEANRQRGQQSQTGTSSTRQQGQGDSMRRSQQGSLSTGPGSSQPQQEAPRAGQQGAGESRIRRESDSEETTDIEEGLSSRDKMRDE